MTKTPADTQPASWLGHDADAQMGASVDRFVVLRRLGAGGMGVVLSAYDPMLGSPLARSCDAVMP